MTNEKNNMYVSNFIAIGVFPCGSSMMSEEMFILE